MEQDLKMGPHDVGGEFSDPIDTLDSGMTHWEKFSNGIRGAVSARKVITLDELRLSAESLGDEYFKMPYFERNGLALVHRCLERELFTEEELQLARTQAEKEFEVPLIDLPNPKSITHLHDGEEHHHHDNDFQEDEAGEGTPSYYFDMLAVAKLLVDRELITMQNVLQIQPTNL